MTVKRYTQCMNDDPPAQSEDALTSDRPRLFVNVAVSRILPGGKQGIYTYAVPEGLEQEIERGLLVIVPIQKRHYPGLVVAVNNEQPNFEARPIHSIPEPRIVLEADRLESAEWLARETASAVYAAASLFLPPGLHTRMVDVYSLVADLPGAGDLDLTTAQRKVIDLLREQPSMTIDQLRNVTGQSLTTVMDKLQQLDFVRQDVLVDQHVPGPRYQRFVRLLDDDYSKTSRSPKQTAILEHLVNLERFRRSDVPDLVAVTDLRDVPGLDASS